MAEMQNPNTDGDSTVLCGANSYVEKYYLNEQFSGLPESIKQELQIMCVMYTEGHRRYYFAGVYAGWQTAV